MADRTSWLARAADLFRAPKQDKIIVPSNQMDVVSQFVAGRPVEPESIDLRKMIDEGYRRNVIIYVCVNEIASSAAAPRVYLRDRKTQDEIEEHELLDLIARPYPGGSWYDLIERLLIFQQVTGTGYLHKGRSGASQIVQLTAARSDRIQPVPDKQGNILYYEYKIEGGDKQRVEPEDLAAFRLPDPLNDFHGLSPLTVSAVFGDIDTAAAVYLRDFFANGAMPMGLLKFKTPSVRREDRLRVQQEWSEQYGATEISPKNAGRWHNVGVIGGDVDYVPLGAEPAQLRLDAVWGMTESRLCATFGVPPAIVQARIGLQFSTYSNQREARRSFWTETLVPIYRRIADGMTRNLVSEYDEDLELVFDLESIPELQEDLNARATRATALFLGGVASFNEARLLSDLEEAKTDFYAFPGTVTMVPREDVETGKYFTDAAESKKKAEDALASKAAAPPFGGAPGEKPPPFGKKPKPGEKPVPPKKGEPPPKEEQAEDVEDEHGLPFEILGLGMMPAESETEILRATESLLGGFSAAVHDAVAASDEAALADALARGDWRAAEKAVNTHAFAQSYGAALEAHLLREAEVAQEMHYRHHAGEPRETHGWVTIKGHPVFIGERGGGGGGGGGATAADLKPGSGAPMDVKPFKSFDPKLGGAQQVADTIAHIKSVYADPGVRIPALSWDLVTGVEVRPAKAYPKKGVTGFYQPDKNRVNVIAQDNHLSRNTPIHELGHHVHMAKISDAASNEWAALSKGGKACKISNYGKTNTGEHFAEAFRNYADTTQPSKPGFQAPREWLKKQEPAVYSFMERLWSNPSMWYGKGQRAKFSQHDVRYNGGKV